MSSIRESIGLKPNIIIVGDFGVGKTSLLHRFIKKEFTKTVVTANLDFYSHEMRYREENVQVFIWDSLGHERFQSMTATFYKKADGVILVFDITDTNNISVVRNWIKTINDSCKEDIPIVIVGNKRDICSIYEKKIKEIKDSFSTTHGVFKITTASAKNGDNVDEFFKKVIMAAYDNAVLKSEVNNNQSKTSKPETVESSDCCHIL